MYIVKQSLSIHHVLNSEIQHNIEQIEQLLFIAMQNNSNQEKLTLIKK